MGDTRGRLRAAALVVVLAVGMLSSLATSPARAAGGFPPQCVESFSGSRIAYETYPLAYVVDLDIEVPWDFRKASSEVALVNGEPEAAQDRVILSDQNSQLRENLSSVVFDDDAPPRYDDPFTPGMTQVRVQPRQPIPLLAFSRPQRWYVEVDRGLSRESNFVVTLTWSDCDTDHDNVGDTSRDNCLGLSNPDQADADGDGIGNACDPTPVTPVTPVPPVPPTPTITVPPNNTSTQGCTNSCAYARTVGLRHRARTHRLVGKVESVADGCRRTVPVTIWKKRSGADRALVVVTTGRSGAFATKAPRKAGRYYAAVDSDAQPLCATGRSRVVKLKRR